MPNKNDKELEALILEAKYEAGRKAVLTNLKREIEGLPTSPLRGDDCTCCEAIDKADTLALIDKELNE